MESDLCLMQLVVSNIQEVRADRHPSRPVSALVRASVTGTWSPVLCSEDAQVLCGPAYTSSDKMRVEKEHITQRFLLLICGRNIEVLVASEFC